MTTATHRIIVIGIVALLLLCYFAYYHRHKNQPTFNKVSSPTTVTVLSLTTHFVPKQVRAYATVVAPNAVDLAAETAGTITSINFTAGQPVKKGQVLFTFISNSVDDETQKLLAAMQLSLDNYQRLWRSYQTDPESVSQAALVQAQLGYQQSLATYQAAKHIETAVSPIDGIVSDTMLAVGDFVNAGTFLVHIDAPNLRELSYQLPSQYQSQVQIGQPVEFAPNDSQTTYFAHVAYIAPQLDPNNYNLTIKANFNEPNTLLANHFGIVTQTLQTNVKTLTLPAKAVQTDSQGFYIYSIDHHNKIEKIYFTPGAVNTKGWIVIKSGLKAGIPIVIAPLSTLGEGQTVRIGS